jgi:hypothetical protein
MGTAVERLPLLPLHRRPARKAAEALRNQQVWPDPVRTGSRTAVYFEMSEDRMPIPTQKQIADELTEAIVAESKGATYPGMTYENGVTAALRWVLGEIDDRPISDD